MREPSPATLLKKYHGAQLTKEMLLGRGYFLEENGKVVDNHFPHIDGVYWVNDSIEETDDEQEEHDITCDDVLNYIAIGVEQNFADKQNYQHWIKCLPAEPEDVDNHEVYIVIMLFCLPQEGFITIEDISIHARMVKEIGGGWISFPGISTLDSHFFEMDLIPPEPFAELDALVHGRYIPEGFTFNGKPKPKNMDDFWPAKNSGWRNIYWHISIETDENGNIDDLDISTYEREVSMFQRPHLMPSDPRDDFDAALYLCDRYSDDEWKEITRGE